MNENLATDETPLVSCGMRQQIDGCPVCLGYGQPVVKTGPFSGTIMETGPRHRPANRSCKKIGAAKTATPIKTATFKARATY